jgi:pimeloyl-ACP methyl ester carboxylesterase
MAEWSPDAPAGMTPVIFDGCFGWFHPAGRRRGAVLCGPIGEEADFVHRVWREFAENLARAGVSALRFDYPGTRNSRDLDDPSQAIKAWVDSIKAAIRWLKDEALIDEVVLVGMRFGTALAVKCAEELGGVGRLVLMAPVSSGSAYQREVAMLAGVSHNTTSANDRPGLERTGTLFTMESVINVQGLEIGQGDVRPAQHVLVLSTPVAAGGRKLIGRLGALGVEIREEPFDGYAALMIVPESAQYPQVAFGKVVDWLRADIDPAAPAAPSGAAVSLSLPQGRETPIFFGAGAPLFGILTTPRRRREDRPGVVFINTSAISQAGTNRMWVSLARRLATLGFTSLRFDICGVGDSPPQPLRPDPVNQMREASEDARAAISRLLQEGCGKITLVGYCWGAQLACNVALADDRVSGLVMINSRRLFWDFATAKYPSRTVQRCLRLARDPARWRRVLKGEIPLSDVFQVGVQLIRGVLESGQTRKARLENRRAKAGRRLRSLKARGVEALLVQGQDDPFLVEFEDYFATPREALAGFFGMKTRYIDGVDHLFRNHQGLSILGEIVVEHFSLPTKNAARKARISGPVSASP